MKEDVISADNKIIGFEYQFLYFILELLKLQNANDKAGYEVKDDVHIEVGDKLVLFQLKYSNSKENLTTFDSDLWKTLSNWSEIIREKSIEEIEKINFYLVTTKNIKNNDFEEQLRVFKEENDLEKIKNTLTDLKEKTKNEKVQDYINNILKLNNDKLLKLFINLDFYDTLDIKKLEKAIKEQIKLIPTREVYVDKIYVNILGSLKDEFIKVVNEKKSLY